MEDDVEPDVGEDAPDGGADEDHHVLDAADFAGRDRRNAEGDDHEEVEGRRADDGAGTQTSGLEFGADDFDEGEEDFRRRGSQRHERQVGDGFVPDFDGDRRRLTGA